MRGSNFSYLVKQGVVSVWHNRVMSFASFCIMMVSLLLLGLTVLLSLNINIVITNIENTNEILVFVDEDLSDSELSHISEILNSQKNEYVDKVIFYSKEQALEDQKAWYREGVAALFEMLGENPMPQTFKVSLWDITRIDEAVERFEKIDGVLKVDAPHDFAELILSIRDTLAVIGIAILTALVAVCLVIIYNTARASVFARRTHISIMKHVGATNSFIKFPFFIEGMFIGMIAGGVSWYLTKIAYESVVLKFTDEIMLLRLLGLTNIISFADITWLVLAANCVAGALLGALGTVFSMGKHLKV